MAKKPEPPRLHVEGKNDRYTIGSLLKRSGIDAKVDPRAALIFETGSDNQLLAGMELAVEDAGGRTIGFVLDADRSLVDRWRAVRDRLRNLRVEDVPETPLAEGFVGVSTKLRTRVGVWLMPDNETEGALEDFLVALIKKDVDLYHYARTVTLTASLFHARYAAADFDKAVLHAWLAWQESPGLPWLRDRGVLLSPRRRCRQSVRRMVSSVVRGRLISSRHESRFPSGSERRSDQRIGFREFFQRRRFHKDA